MNTHELDKANMDSVKELADTNIKISEAKNILFKLQGDEKSYLDSREVKALEVVQKVLNDSAELLKEAKGNYLEIHELCTTANQFVQFLLEGYAQFQNIVKDFNEHSELWEQKIRKREGDLAEVRRGLEVDKTVMANDRKSLETAKKQFLNDKKKLESDQGTLQRAIKRLKENRI